MPVRVLHTPDNVQPSLNDLFIYASVSLTYTSNQVASVGNGKVHSDDLIYHKSPDTHVTAPVECII